MTQTAPNPVVKTTTRLPKRIPLFRAAAWLGAFLLIYLAGQWLFDTGTISKSFYMAAVQICIFIIAAVSLNLITGITGQFSLGHAGFMTVGAYTAAVLTHDVHAPFPLALLAGGVMAGALGVLVGLPTLRLRGDYLAIATLGMGEIVRVIFENIPSLGGASGFTGIRKPAPLFGLGDDGFALWGWSILFTVLTLLLISQFIRSSHGRACIAIREDELAAETMGITTVRFKVLAFSVGALFAGIAGGLLAHLVRTITPANAGFLKSVEILVMVVLGGLGSLSGSTIAAAVLTIINFATSDLSTVTLPFVKETSALRTVIYALLLVLLMIFRPHGLWSGRLRLPWRRGVRDVA